MATSNPFTVLPPNARKIIYAVYGFAALLVALIDVGFSAAGESDPTWLTVTQALIAYLAVPIGALAVSNTPASPAEVAEAADNGKHKAG